MVKNRENVDALGLWDVKDQIGKSGNDRAADLPVNDPIRVRKRSDAFKPLLNRDQE